MTNVISPPARKAGDTAAPTAITIPPALGSIERQQALENALSMALYHVRHGNTRQALHAAMVKAVRAVSMLKQACAKATIRGRA